MSNFFIKRPIVVMVIAILTVIVGAVSIARLPMPPTYGCVTRYARQRRFSPSQ